MSTSTKQLAEFIAAHQPLTVITGAGCSSASGIPTYRDDDGVWLRTDPIQHGDFMGQHSKRQRYWARSFTGWPYVQAATPNETHKALARLEAEGYINLLVTQNVDRLHQRSGSRNVIDLHGRLDEVHCTDCYAILTREEMQIDLARLNPHLDKATGEIAPDGDADVADGLVARMTVPDCAKCGGILKPSVVFYGGGVEKGVVQSIYAALDNSQGLLVVGSSLMVFSSFRFCRYANQHDIPIAILNPGKTRADDLATLKIPEGSEHLLPQVVTLIKGSANNNSAAWGGLSQ